MMSSIKRAWAALRAVHERIGVRKKPLILLVLAVAVALTILANVVFLKLTIIGAVASSLYIGFVGFLLGKTFLGDEEDVLARSLFGIFLTIALWMLVGTPLAIFYTLNIRSLAVVLFVPVALLGVLLVFRTRSLAMSGSESRRGDDVPYLSPIYIVPVALIVYAEFLVVVGRSGWIRGTIWDAVSPSFFIVYFLAAFSLFGVIMYSKTKATSKMILVIMFSLVSITISAVVLYAGDVGDQMGTAGQSRIMFDYGSLWRPYDHPLNLFTIYWLLKRGGLPLLTSIGAKMFFVDVYWVHILVTAVIWGVFVPLVAYKITKMVGGEDRVSVLAAFLTTFFSMFLIWGKITTNNSIGYVFFFVSLYFAVRYLKSERELIPLLLALGATLATVLAHFFTGEMAFTFLLLAFAFKRYRNIKIKSTRRAYVLIFVSFMTSILVVPATFGLQNFVYLNFANPSVRANYLQEVIMFSPAKVLEADPWALIFGDYLGFSFKDLFLDVLMPVLGFIGLVYTLSKKDRYERLLASFLFLAFVICLIDYRVMTYAMVNVPFGPGRIWVMRDLIAVPFMAVTVNSFVELFEGGTLSKVASNPGFKGLAKKFSVQRVAACVLVGLSLGAFAVASIERTYSLVNTLHPTQLEVETVKYIDEHTDGRYVVLSTNTWSAMIGWAFVGSINPEKYYVYGRFSYPSVSEMMSYIKLHEAEVGYFLVPYFRTVEPDEVIAEASRNFGLFKVLSDENGEIYIFNYKIPPLPPDHPNPNADVMAFYWSTPSSYIIQNGFGRVAFNLGGINLDVTDYWGDLYESIDIGETLVGGKAVGSLISVEYFDPSNETWIAWPQSEDLFQVQRFQFRLNFENNSLIGIVEKGKPFVQLSWEVAGEYLFTVLPGEFQRLYIPGLVGARTPYDLRRHQFGLLYTISRTDDVVLAPGYLPESEYGSSLDFTQIQRNCSLTITDKYLSYDFSVRNDAAYDQWAQIEVWIPDEIYMGISPSLISSVDGGLNWTSGGPLKTLGGADVNWAVSLPGNSTQKPVVWKYIRSGIGGREELAGNFTDSSGGQRRLLLSIYLPAGDEALVRLSFPVYYLRPLKITYVFRDLEDMEEGLIKYYDYGSSAYVGGLTSTLKPSALTIVVDEEGRIASILITFPVDTAFSFHFSKENTIVDEDGNEIPDSLE